MAEKTKEELEAEKSKAKGEERKEEEKTDKKDEIDPAIAEIMKNPDAVLSLLTAKRAANDEAKQYRLRLEKIEKDQEDAKKKTLEQQGEFKALAEKEKTEKETMQARFIDYVIASSLKIEAVREGMIDPEDIALVAQKDLKVSDDFSQVEGAKEAVENMKKLKPYLFKPAGEGGAGGREDVRPGQRGGGGSDENLTPSQRIAKYLEGKK